MTKGIVNPFVLRFGDIIGEINGKKEELDKSAMVAFMDGISSFRTSFFFYLKLTMNSPESGD